jgi:mannose-6-phosphate isomerase-like protein (cupin superfamily)
MKRAATTLLFGLLLPAIAAWPPDFMWWPASTLKAFQKSLAPKINAQKVATEQLGKFGNHLVMVAHREGSGEAELHEHVIDVFVAQTGQATLVVGGKIVGGKSTGPGEVRGVSIEGGEKKPLAPGDIANIPANTPHQVLLDPGKQFTYVIVKIEE